MAQSQPGASPASQKQQVFPQDGEVTHRPHKRLWATLSAVDWAGVLYVSALQLAESLS